MELCAISNRSEVRRDLTRGAVRGHLSSGTNVKKTTSFQNVLSSTMFTCTLESWFNHIIDFPVTNAHVNTFSVESKYLGFNYRSFITQKGEGRFLRAV